MLNAVEPLIAAAAGGTILTLQGRNFAEGGEVMCRVGDKVVLAQVLSQGRMRCQTPELPVGYHSVQLSMNGQNFVDDGLMVEVRHVHAHMSACRAPDRGVKSRVT